MFSLGVAWRPRAMPAKIALNVITDSIQAIDDLDDATKLSLIHI